MKKKGKGKGQEKEYFLTKTGQRLEPEEYKVVDLNDSSTEKELLGYDEQNQGNSCCVIL